MTAKSHPVVAREGNAADSSLTSNQPDLRLDCAKIVLSLELLGEEGLPAAGLLQIP